MLRTHWITNSAAAKEYYQAVMYYAKTPGDWLGRSAETLGLRGEVKKEDFFALCDNVHPQTEQSLTTYTREGRRVGIDFNFNSSKSVGIIRELAGDNNQGDDRVEMAHREAVTYAMRYVEDDMQCRIRVGGKDEDRFTGNMVAMRLTHRDTRINEDDRMPDMSLHDHVVVFNATFDPIERKWKATQIGEIKHDAPYYEAIYHNRLASNLRELGYGIRRKDKSFEVEGVSKELIDKFSRRRATINKVAEELGLTSAAARDKLGATTRLGKSTEATEDLGEYWRGRLSPSERRELTQLMGNSSYESNERQAVQFAIEHHFERQSVVDERRLYEAAIRYGIGSVTPEAVIEETKHQGVLVKEKQATTRHVLAEESRIIDFARETRGTMRPLGQEPSNQSTLPSTDPGAKLSREQEALVSHVLRSTDQIVLVIGDAGTGKTRSIKNAFQQINRPIEMLAPSADASRGVLRSEGFSKADTVASFLQNDKRQAAIKNGVIWLDEAGLLPIKDFSHLVDVAKQQNARIVLQGDPKQHRSVARHGNMMHVLQVYAGLPVGRLTEIWRQVHQGYKAVVAQIASGKQEKAFDKLVALGWVQKVDGNATLVNDYMEALQTKKAKQDEKDRVIVIAPTHFEGDTITAEIRDRLKVEGRLSKEERVFHRLVPLGWTQAEREDPASYQGTEVVQFHRNSGPYKAGQRIEATDLRLGHCRPQHYAVYEQGTLSIAPGEVIRITANARDKSGKHKLDNGSIYTVKRFTPSGDLVLNNDWIVSKNCGHLSHGYVTTSHASQGKTVDRVLIAMGSQSLRAINAEQFYVSVSRGRQSAKIYSDLTPEELRSAIKRSDTRKSATELMGTKSPQPKVKDNQKIRDFMQRVAAAYRQLQERTSALISKQANKEQELGHGR